MILNLDIDLGEVECDVPDGGWNEEEVANNIEIDNENLPLAS